MESEDVAEAVETAIQHRRTSQSAFGPDKFMMPAVSPLTSTAFGGYCMTGVDAESMLFNVFASDSLGAVLSIRYG